jgi:E-phenylitaconyl-CoA hydratase
MERLGLDYQTMKRRNPRLVYCSISAYGQQGPEKDLPGVDGVVQAVSGLMSVTGMPDAPPCKVLSKLHTDKPVIAAINGYALGGGLELALLCDVRIASSKAIFSLPEVGIGSIPGAGGTQRLIRAVGRSDAMMMLLTGERIDAAEALRIGLVSRVVEPEALQDAARALALKIASNAPLAVAAVKRLARIGVELPLAAGLELEQHAFGVLRDSEDRIEGRMAFAEKRKPVFRGR